MKAKGRKWDWAERGVIMLTGQISEANKLVRVVLCSTKTTKHVYLHWALSLVQPALGRACPQNSHLPAARWTLKELTAGDHLLTTLCIWAESPSCTGIFGFHLPIYHICGILLLVSLPAPSCVVHWLWSAFSTGLWAPHAGGSVWFCSHPALSV